MIYAVGNNSTFNVKNQWYECIFWTLGGYVKTTSPYPFNKGDLVEITKIANNTVYIRPTQQVVESVDDVRVLVFLSNPIPVSSDSDYEFTSESSEILLVRECEQKGNKKYILIIGAKVGGPNFITGTDKHTGTQYEFRVDIDVDTDNVNA